MTKYMVHLPKTDGWMMPKRATWIPRERRRANTCQSGCLDCVKEVQAADATTSAPSRPMPRAATLRDFMTPQAVNKYEALTNLDDDDDYDSDLDANDGQTETETNTQSSMATRQRRRIAAKKLK